MNTTTSYKFIRSDINSLMCQLDNISDLHEASANLHMLVEQMIIERANKIGKYDEYIGGIFEEVVR